MGDESAIARAVRSLRARRDEIDEAIFTRFRRMAHDTTALDNLAGFDDPEYVAGMRAAIAAGVDYVLVGLERPQGCTPPPIPQPTLSQASRAARAGVRLDTVLRRYVAGHAILEDYLMQEVARHGDLAGQTATTLRRMLQASASLLDRLIPSIASVYTQELESGVDALSRPGSGGMSRHGEGAASPNGRAGIARDQAAPDARTRIISALVEVSAEYGFAHAKVSVVLARAGVSSRTFYEQFAGLEACLAAVIVETADRVMTFVPRELASAERWQDGVRAALGAVLAFFDAEPELARVYIVDAMAGGSLALEKRKRSNEVVIAWFIDRIEQETGRSVPALAAEGVLSAVLGVLHAHIVAGQIGPFIDLLGPLMGLVMALYLGARGVEREIQRGDELARAIRAGEHHWASKGMPEHVAERVAGTAAAHPVPNSRRARECLLFLAEHPGASNREIAAALGIAHPSQTSKLLADLAGKELMSKSSAGSGKVNTSRLTKRGEQVARALERSRV